MGLTALLYNWGFFTVLGYAPFPMRLNTHLLGIVFTGWGVLVAIFAVFGAPRLQARFGIGPALYANLALFAIDIAVIAIFVTDQAVLITAVILTGIFIGVNNTVTTQAVMTVAPVERSVASAAYGFIRFIGGGLAPYFAGRMAQRWGPRMPFFARAASVALAIVVLVSAHRLLAVAEQNQAATAARHAAQAAEDEALAEELGSAT
jgi:ACDE family multidrug resistance protein